MDSVCLEASSSIAALTKRIKKSAEFYTLNCWVI